MPVRDDTLKTLTGYRLQRATGIAMLRYKKVFAAYGLRRTTFSCLALIVDTPGLRQSQLGDALAIERPNLVTIVEDLTRQRLIHKEVSPEDRRAYALRPTPDGIARFAQAYAAVQALDAEITDGMDAAEVNALHSALAKVEKNAAGCD